MHTLLLASGLIVALLLALAVSLMDSHGPRGLRLGLRMALRLLLPLASLTLATMIFPIVDLECVTHSASRDQVLSLGLSALLLGYSGRAVARAIERRARLGRLVQSLEPIGDQRLARALGRIAGAGAPEGKVIDLDHPVAFLRGWIKPTVFPFVPFEESSAAF